MIGRAIRFCALLLAALFYAGSAWAETRIFVASSLVDLAQEVKAAAQLDVKIVAGGSSTLARQIRAGAPASLYISANEQWAQRVAGQRDLLPLFGNRLVLVGHQPGPVDIAALPQVLGDQRLALADPRHVPAGLYAKAALQHLGLWAALTNRLAAAQNVRGAARFVQSGAAPYGVIYGSDAKALDMSIAYEFPADMHPPVRYWAVRLRENDPAVEAFLAFMNSAEGHKLLRDYGFQPIERAQ
ncbi:molybdate ABC transporter substrate-binding protein [Maritalea mediterranea]|uniref:Molybdate ABC transporter substrate-binding protein n=1 Tax=Maritalea mediterranea TaxID=2909667 RepID=A0ABS9E9K5_9HYPH|nr:molybdate ABC transporter substrate-binding protein [Maritalea mediterranea]MCF4099565.1 molybdate ABC transporter substrate-binding protein [Maritalea mediterranea]